MSDTHIDTYEGKKQRLAEIDLTIENSEALIAQTLEELGVTRSQFILLLGNSRNQSQLN